ncbi:MAG TPA: helix-hairpin-helix domain-containing protein [Firmicutes bacterium]|nr:helix-hairpin-helix domain-containing protein [Bacillota bacterium]
MGEITRQERTVLIIIFSGIILGFFVNIFAPVKAKIPEIRKEEIRININTDNPEKIMKLPGIGPAYARRIIESREKEGPFRKKEDLTRVNGIGPATAEKIAPYLVFE